MYIYIYNVCDRCVHTHTHTYIYIYIYTLAISTTEVLGGMASGFRTNPKAGGAAQSLRHPSQGLRGGMEGSCQEEGPWLRFLWLLRGEIWCQKWGRDHERSIRLAIRYQSQVRMADSGDLVMVTSCSRIHPSIVGWKPQPMSLGSLPIVCPVLGPLQRCGTNSRHQSTVTPAGRNAVGCSNCRWHEDRCLRYEFPKRWHDLLLSKHSNGCFPMICEWFILRKAGKNVTIGIFLAHWKVLSQQTVGSVSDQWRTHFRSPFLWEISLPNLPPAKLKPQIHGAMNGVKWYPFSDS